MLSRCTRAGKLNVQDCTERASDGPISSVPPVRSLRGRLKIQPLLNLLQRRPLQMSAARWLEHIQSAKLRGEALIEIQFDVLTGSTDGYKNRDPCSW